MRVFIFVCLFIIVFSSLMYFDGNRTIYDNWLKVKDKNISLFSDEINTIKLKVSPTSEEEFFVLYGDNKKGIYCMPIDDFKNIFICTPIILNKKTIESKDYLVDVIKVSKQKKGFMAKISYYNFIYFKKLNISTAPLNLDCLADEKCKFKDLDMYISFNYNILKRLKIMKDYNLD